MHDCPHPDCRLQIPWALFACITHWNQLLTDIQNATNTARHHLTRGLDDDRTQQHAVIALARHHWATT